MSDSDIGKKLVEEEDMLSGGKSSEDGKASRKHRADILIKDPRDSVMETNSETHVSVIGVSLIRPILTLVETLESEKPVAPKEVKTGDRENGYSCAIAAIAVFLLESALNRTHYVRDEDAKRFNPTEYFVKISPNPKLAADVEEVFAVRDAIVHNHLWKANTFWDANGSLKFKEPPQLHKAYGSPRLT